MSEKFFSRLGDVCQQLDKDLSLLDATRNSIARRDRNVEFEGEPAQEAEKILEDILSMREGLGKARSAVAAERAHMESFLEEAMTRAEEMLDKVKKIEQWGAQYGYTPTFNLDLNLNDFLQESLDKENYECESDTKEEKPAANTPSLLGAGISKDTLRSFGYTFREDVAKAPSIDESAPCSPFTEDGTTDEDTPRPIIKAPKVSEATPAVCPAPPEHSLETPKEVFAATLEVSRVEITPGLFVRKKKQGNSTASGNGKTNCQLPSKALLPEVAPAPIDLTPPIPELKTVNLKELLEQPTEKFNICNRENRRPNWTEDNEDNCTPEFPEFKDRSMEDLVRSAAKKRAGGSTARPPATSSLSSEEKSTPELPELKDKAMDDLVRSVSEHHSPPPAEYEQQQQEEITETPKMPALSRATLDLLKQ